MKNNVKADFLRLKFLMRNDATIFLLNNDKSVVFPKFKLKMI